MRAKSTARGQKRIEWERLYSIKDIEAYDGCPVDGCGSEFMVRKPTGIRGLFKFSCLEFGHTGYVYNKAFRFKRKRLKKYSHRSLKIDVSRLKTKHRRDINRRKNSPPRVRLMARIAG